jgi:hypothetical protein
MIVVVGGIVVVDVVVVVGVDVVVVGSDVVEVSSVSAAPDVQAERINPSATNLAIVGRMARV